MNNNGKKMVLKHGLGMMICCMLPILLLAFLPLLGIRAAWLSSLASLICPFGMIFMMFGMRHANSKNCCSEKDNQEAEIQEKR